MSNASGVACGRQPSPVATAVMIAAWSSSMMMTVAVLAEIRPPRDRGVAPSRLSTPYRRSKPVAIAWLVNAVDMTARAMMPGARKSTRLPLPRFTRGSRLNMASSPSGMTIVTVSCSPFRSSERVSIAVCAAIIRGSGAAPGRRERGFRRRGRGGRGHGRSSFPVSSRKTSSSVRLSIRRLVGRTPCSAHHAVTEASSCGLIPSGTSMT